jgi:hypothetical protein
MTNGQPPCKDGDGFSREQTAAGGPSPAWRARAEDLARWTWRRYFIRHDVWDCYLPLS